MLATEKKLVLTQWTRFLKALKACDYSNLIGADYGEFPSGLERTFTPRLYKHLSLHLQFCAHYNRYGFLSARFSSQAITKETLSLVEQSYTTAGFMDLHQAMLEALTAHKQGIWAHE